MAAVVVDELVEVYADVTCPFAHVGLRRLVEARARRGLLSPGIRVHPWPLELVNGVALTGPEVAPKVEALKACLLEPRFAGFDAARFPHTSLPAFAAEAAAYRVDVATGERFALAIRDALFERGLDIGDVDVVAAVCREHGVPLPDARDDAAVLEDYQRGVARGVRGSPHFFSGGTDLFCPSLHIERVGDRFEIGIDHERFAAFERSTFERPRQGSRR